MRAVTGSRFLNPKIIVSAKHCTISDVNRKKENLAVTFKIKNVL